MSEPTVVDARLDKLERDNRRLKLTVGALLVALAVTAVMSQRIPDVIQARAFEVIDETGNFRASISDEVMLLDENGQIRSSMHYWGFMHYDENGTDRVGISADGIGYADENGSAVMTGLGISYRDENENIRARMNHNGFFSYDENENRRAVVGENRTPRAAMTATGIRYADENGTVVWRTPER